MSSAAPSGDEMPRPRRWYVLALFVVLTLAVAITAGLVTAPKIPGWYQQLQKPSFNPPAWAFAPAWTTLYLMMSIAGWRVWERPHSPRRSRALGWFFVQLVLNFLWSPAFFGMESPGLGLAVIVPLLLAIAVTIRSFWPVDRIAALLLAPYIAWVGFATVLNAAIYRLN